MIKLIEKKHTGLELVTWLNNTKSAEMGTLYSLEETKKAIAKAISENNQDDLLRIINVNEVKKVISNEIFINEYLDEINNNIDNNLSFENLELEYKMFIEKYNALGNPKATFNEIMMYDFDKDKMMYDKDINVIKRVLKVNKNMYLWGNRGNGKTTLAQLISKDLNLKCYNINSIKEEYDLKGYNDIMTNEYQFSNLENWYINGGVLLLDEVDTYDSNAMLYLNMIIEVNNKSAMFGNGVEYTKNKDCYVIGCANTNGEGRNSTYSGRNVIDKAFMDRFIIKEFKEYTYIHKQILKDDYKYALDLCKNVDVDLTCRTCVKIKNLLDEFTKEELKEIVINKEIDLI